MQVFDNEWASTKDPVTWECLPNSQSEVRVSCTSNVELRGIRDDGTSVLLHAGSVFRITAYFRGYRELLLRGSGDEFGYRVRQIPRQDGEPLNKDNPPAPPVPGNDNLLLQVRRIMRAEFDRNRAPYLDPEDFPQAGRYEIEDDDYLFEEEIGQQRLAEREREAQPASQPDPGPSSDLPTQEPSQPPAAPEARPTRPALPSTAHAAE